MHENDRAAVRGYLLNAVRDALRNRKAAARLADWVRSNCGELDEEGIADLHAVCETHEEPDSDPTGYRGMVRGGFESPRRATDRDRALLSEVAATLAETPILAPGDELFSRSPTARAAQLFASRLGFDRVSAAVIHLGHLHGESGVVQGLWDNIHESRKDPVATAALLLGAGTKPVDQALLALLEAGFFRRDRWNSSSLVDSVTGDIESIWQPPVENDHELVERLLTRPTEPSLALDRFSNLPDRDEAVALLAGALRDAAPGVNLLLHGRPGTGKTEFAKTLAAAAGGCLYSIGEPAPDSASWKRDGDRRPELRRADLLLKAEGKAVLLCDESDDVFASQRHEESRDRLSRLRLLEENRTPTIYTANRIDTLDEAVLRRFTIALRFTALSPRRRTTMFRRMLEESKLPELEAAEAIPELANRLSVELEAPPGVVERAILATRLTGGGTAALFRHAERLERTISGVRAIPRLGAPVRPKHPWAAFSHLGADAEDTRRSLAAAVFGERGATPEEPRKGVNLLFYGPPGTGKTEFAATLCAEIGACLYSVGQREFGPDARVAADRWECLEYALESLADEPGAVILFDEMEDLPGMPKHWMNRVLEENRTPILWASNATDYYRACEPFFLDRMLLSVEFRSLPPPAKREIYQGILSKRSVVEEASAALADEFSRMPDVTPRQVTLASAWPAVEDGDAEGIRRNLERKRRLRRGAPPASLPTPALYDPKLLRADCDLLELADRIVRCGPRRMGLLFSGPPGTGKTEFVRYLAKRWDREILPRRASDLLDRYVGESEKNIARAFAEARDLDAILVLDEADSLLADRRAAQHRWELGQVNELLGQMEAHPLPFACTTNFADALDPAAARRFLFRAEFRCLDRAGVARAFRLFFEGDAPPDALALEGLTPADFANARDRAVVLGFRDDPARIVEDLRREGRASGGPERPIGFAPATSGRRSLPATPPA